MANTVANEIDGIEATLEAKMLDADMAGNVTLRDAYQRRLEKLRADRVARAAGATVVSIDAWRRA